MPEVEGPPVRTPVTSSSQEPPTLPNAPIPESEPLGLGEILEDDRFQITDEELAEAARVSVYEGGDHAWNDVTAQMMRSSCASMAQELLRGPPEAPYNGRFLIGEHHEEWDHLVTHYDRLCVLAPRDHGKTFFFDFAYPIWRAAHEPRGIGFIFSATQPQAERILEPGLLHNRLPVLQPSRGKPRREAKARPFFNTVRICAGRSPPRDRVYPIDLDW